MSLLTGYKTSKAISVLATTGTITSVEGKQAVASLRQAGAAAVPKILDALHEYTNTSILEQLLAEFISNETLDSYTLALGNAHPKVSEVLTSILAKSRLYNPNKLFTLFDNPAIPNKVIREILLSQKNRIDIKKLLVSIDKVSSNARPIVYQLLDACAVENDIHTIIAKTQSKEPLVRAYLASLLSKFNNKSAKHTLTQMLVDPIKVVKQAALKSLAILKSRDSVELICQLLSDPDMTVQATAIESLITINAPDTVHFLIEVLQDESDYVRRAAVEVLNEIGDQRAIKDLINALRDADWWVKVRAADALGTIGGPKVFAAVLTLINDKDEFMRRTAVEILNTCKDIKAFDKLVEALNDEDWWVRERAADALAGLGDKRAVQPLLAMLSRSPEASQVVLRALTSLGDPTAIDPILNLLTKQDENTQKDVLKALKSLTNKNRYDDVEYAVTQLIESPFKEVRKMADETLQSLLKTFGETKFTVDSHSSIDMPPIAMEASSNSKNSAQIQLLDAAQLKPDDIFADRYRVIRHIGKGAFGIVVLVEDTLVSDQFVLKILNPHVSSDEYSIKRFTQELRYARKVTHENVIRIYDFIKHHQTYAISMEYFHSHSLREEIANPKKLTVHRIMRILISICEGMSAAQSADIIHRDLKPGNILINGDDFVKIVDFGLAAAASKSDSRITKTGLLVGTPTYMAPEQVRGKTIDCRTDIYALGIIMYELFTGEPPYQGEDSMSVMFQHVEANFKRPREIKPDIPPLIEMIIVKAMSLRATNRFQSFDQLKRNLQSLTTELA